MAKNEPHVSSVQLSPGVGSHVASLTEYGVQYPDGTIDWTLTRDNIDIKTSIVERKGFDYWADRMKSRAESANMSIEEYTAAHKLLERTVIVSITEAREYAK